MCFYFCACIIILNMPHLQTNIHGKGFILNVFKFLQACVQDVIIVFIGYSFLNVGTSLHSARHTKHMNIQHHNTNQITGKTQ